MKAAGVLSACLSFSLLASGGRDHDEGDRHHEEPNVSLTQEQYLSAGIKTEKAARRSFAIEVEALGEIASDTDRVVQLRPQVSGTAADILVSIGDTVDAGDVILVYRPGADGAEGPALTASRPGVVVGLFVAPGSHLDTAVPVATLADISRLRCSLDVYEKDIARIKKGQAVRFSATAFPKETFDGIVTYISPRVDPHSRTIRVRADIANQGGRLKFGMFIVGRIRVSVRSVLAVSESAIQKYEGRTIVFVASKKTPGRYVFAPNAVTIGERSGSYVEVTSGLKVSDEVAVKGSFLLKSELAKEEMGGHSH